MRWIVFGEDWGRHPSSTQHLFKQIIPQDEVVWVNSMGLRFPQLNSHDLQRAKEKLSAMLKQASHQKGTHNDELQPLLQPQHLIQPNTIPLFKSSKVRQFNCHQLRKQLVRLPKAETSPTVLWISLPSAVDMVGLCNEDFSIYYCGDDFSSLAGVDHDVISKMEAELVERCDLILAASPALAEKFPVGKTRLLEHGVDYDLFSQPRTKPYHFSERPVIGFYGQLADWVDIELLGKIADQYPEYDLMIIGAVNCSTQISTGDLLSKSNVHWISALPHHQLAAYCQHWQVALLPFKDCPQIQHCNPLKLREYLASGTEVLSTAYPAAVAYQGLVHLSPDYQHSSFLNSLNTVLEQQALQSTLVQQQRKQQRQQSVINQSWTQKAIEVRQHVLQATGAAGSISAPLNTLHYMG